MKMAVRAMSVVFSLSLAILLVAGCSKKAAKAPDNGKEMSRSIVTTKPTDPRGGAASRSSGGTTGERSPEVLIAMGEDIPISEAPTLEFIDPSPEDKLILRNIYFDYDRSNIKAEFQPVLEGIAEWLNQRGQKQLLVQGHCDERGTEEYNLALGERRALSVRRYLVGLGISPDRLHTISYGEVRPADPGQGETAWAKNRRGEFKVSAN